MAALKTQPNNLSVTEFINSLDNNQRKKDGLILLDMMKEITGKDPVMWGDSIIGYGKYHYKYESGREGDWFITGFSPRKQSMTLYIMSGFKKYDELLNKLGKHKTGSSCLYINKLEDVNINILKELIKTSYEYMDKKYN